MLHTCFACWVEGKGAASGLIIHGASVLASAMLSALPLFHVAARLLRHHRPQNVGTAFQSHSSFCANIEAHAFLLLHGFLAFVGCDVLKVHVLLSVILGKSCLSRKFAPALRQPIHHLQHGRSRPWWQLQTGGIGIGMLVLQGFLHKRGRIINFKTALWTGCTQMTLQGCV